MILVFIGVRHVRDILPKYLSEFCWPSPVKKQNEKWVFIEKSMCKRQKWKPSPVRDKEWEKWPKEGNVVFEK